jgi:hypothetical protein
VVDTSWAILDCVAWVTRGDARGRLWRARAPRVMLDASMTPFPPSRLAAILVACALASACASSPSTSDLPPLDLAPAKGTTFDPDEIIPAAAFTDALSLEPADIQRFLEQTPYGRSSFLSTYQSSGILAADAIAAAAATYRINPIVFLVRAEVAGGLIGAKTYPLPADQVEYVFGCGCTSPTNCESAFAGFDKQVDCLGNTLRTSLDEITATGETAGGWGPGVSAVTLDGVHVTPRDASTAALYQYDPIVGQGKSDNWLVWNVWQLYVDALAYAVPPNPGADATAQIGDPCLAATDCAIASPVCATGKDYPGGLCTSKCNGTCPGNDSFCADFTNTGYCLAMCNPTDPASCRSGYTCMLISQYMGSGSANPASVCAPM